LKSYPIDSILPELKDALLGNASVVLHAPAGAGKTTRVPLALLDLLPTKKSKIIVLEPRRIAAVSAARWMAKMLKEEIGETIGYSIRFDSRTSENTRIEVVTEAILTRRIQSDPGLENVSMIIFDEFHERSLHADLALSLCLDLRKGLREDLKILIMSATLDPGPVSSFLDNAPVIRSEGKIFPVEEYYIAARDKSLKEQVVEAIAAALKETSGDILVFLPGAGEIRAVSEKLRNFFVRSSNSPAIHLLYGALSFEEQERAILPSDRRKIVLATNIAETSLTIEGVHVVIDSGLTRGLRFDPASGMNRLVTLSVTKSSAEQRKGRAGRLGPGVCYRLYSRQNFQAMVQFETPEILVSDLSSLVLELAVWGVKDPSALLWLDVPAEPALNSAVNLLTDLGALDRSGSVTRSGRKMAKLPLHPRLAKIIVRSEELDCVGLGADLAALLSERDIIRRDAANLKYSKEADISERIDLLQNWRKTDNLPVIADIWALRTVERTSKQLLQLMGGKSGGEEMHQTDLISRLLLCAFPDRIAKIRDKGEGFLLRNGRGARLSSFSSLLKSPFVVAANVDAGEKTEGFIHLAASVEEGVIRQECMENIETLRRIEWDRRSERIVATTEERLGALVLSSKPFSPTDEESVPLLCGVIRSGHPGILNFSREVRQFQARVALVRRYFPGEKWPDISDVSLVSGPEEWLSAWLSGIRTADDLRNLDILPALRAQFSWEMQCLLEERAPVSLVVPSGSRITIDYISGDLPILAVKLQEMFGLANTPQIADGRVKMLLHLLSPARRPVQVTQDLKGFWNSGYQLVKKELKGRYPKHPWPDDPWNAIPTRKLKPRVQ
jgi:ATP-dependent helicase HrpB